MATTLDGKSNCTSPHFAGPLDTHCAVPASAPVSVPGVAHIVAVYLPGLAKVGATHGVAAPQVEVA
jgi:hypothetical protein